MATYRWYNGSHSFFPEVYLANYTVAQHTATQMVLALAQPSPWDLADQVVFTVLNGETWYNAVTGKSYYTAGTITGITYLKANGTKLIEITGLNVDAAIATINANWSDPYLAQSNFWDLVLTNDPVGSLFLGSSSAGTTAEENWHWNGYVVGDDIATTTGNDTVRAGDGNDYISDSGGVDRYDGQAGDMDVVSYYLWRNANLVTQRGITGDLQTGRVVGPDGKVDTLVSIEGLRGTNYADLMRGSAADNTLNGAAGNDTLDGRDGFDTAFYGWDNAHGIVVNMATGTVRDGFGGRDRLISIERVVGTSGADRFVDTSGAQSFDGGYGADSFSLGTGNDTVTGGEDADVFKFIGTDFGTDVITDFKQEQGDVIQLTGATGFAELTVTAVGSDMVIGVGASSITLAGFVGTISASDFEFI